MLREKQLSILYQKQGRATQFRSKAAHDEWLQSDIDKYEKVLSSNEDRENRLKDEIAKLESDLAAQTEYAEVRETDVTALEARISSCRQGFNKRKAERDELHDKRKSLWGTESELNTEIERLKAEVVKAEKALDDATPGDIRWGISCVRRICRDYNISGVYSSIIELLECDEILFTAVEVTAGNSLFHVVVENDEISTRVIRYLNAERGGRVTFIPLNRVEAPNVSYPPRYDVIPLLKKLKYSSTYDQAFRQVFARTVICQDIDVATCVARTDGLDCITAEDKEINEIISQRQKDDADVAHKRSELEQLKQDVASDNKHMLNISEALDKKLKLLANVQTQFEQIKANIAMKRDEMGTELVDHLTPEERTEIRKAELETNLDRKQELEAVRQLEVEEHATELSTVDFDHEETAKISLHAILGKPHPTTMKVKATLNTVQTNLKEMFMIFTIDGKQYKLQGAASGPQKSSSFQHLAIEPDNIPCIPAPLQPVVTQYMVVFEEP
ncbi:structural maintenance of chromosomes protein 3-like [Bidens hawaiensis]|uniref:structural maintenance of chromosomes protein 3-like n=1 Tax=Bidens hawaiensis TaxID=980011 RepID=UPI00404ACE7F